MLNKQVRLSQLQALLSARYQNLWLDWEVETIMSELGFPDYLVYEKLNVLKLLNKGVNTALSDPVTLSLLCSVTNNDYCDFEVFNLPSCLELAWALTEAKKVASQTGQKFLPSEELRTVVKYILVQEGFSVPLPPFDFLDPSDLTAGQTTEDTSLKAKAIRAYIAYMEKIPSDVLVNEEPHETFVSIQDHE